MADEAGTDLHMKPRDLLGALVVSLTIVAVTAITVSAFVKPPEERPVARVTTDDLRAMADMARRIQRNPHSTPAQVRTADRLVEVVEAVEDGEVEIVPNTTAPPTTSTTTTSTTTAPPSTTAPVGSRQNPATWPGVDTIVPTTLLPPQVP